MSTPPVGGGNPYVNYSGNPLRANAAPRAFIPMSAPLTASSGGLRARDVKAVVHHTAAGDVVEYNASANVAQGAIRNANPPAPHGGGAYAFQKR